MIIHNTNKISNALIHFLKRFNEYSDALVNDCHEFSFLRQSVHSADSVFTHLMSVNGMIYTVIPTVKLTKRWAWYPTLVCSDYGELSIALFHNVLSQKYTVYKTRGHTSYYTRSSLDTYYERDIKYLLVTKEHVAKCFIKNNILLYNDVKIGSIGDQVKYEIE